VISWPLGFVMLALGKGKWFLTTETVGHIVHVILILVFLRALDLPGVGVAFFSLYALYVLIVFGVANFLTQFSWSSAALSLNLIGSILLIVTLAVVQLSSEIVALSYGLLVLLIASVACLRGLVYRLGSESSFAKRICLVPGIRQICGF
jgi:PST family polysaccharide transporter